MASTNDFLVQLLAKLDVSSVNKEFEELKKRLTNDPVIQKVTLDTSMSKQAIRSMASEIHNELGKAFKATGIESFDITVKDVESILSSAVKESNKLAKELESASSKAQKFLAQFNNKSGGTLINSKEFKAVQDAINGLGKTSSIDDLNKAMNTLETTYNNMVSSLRNSGKSLNPFINAKNEMATMDDTIKGIGLEFEKLTSKPKAVSDAIKQLSTQQSKVNSYTIGTQEWADAYGKLQQMVQKVNSEISNLRKAQSAKVSTQIFNTSDLKNNNIAYMSKVYNTIEKQMVEINRLAKAKDWQIVDVSGVEQADGKIKKLTLTVRDAEGALKKLDMQREKLQGNGKAQYGLMQVGDVKILETASQAQEKLAQSTEKANAKLAEQANKIQLSFDTGSYQSKVDSLVARTNQWVDANGNARISTESLQTALNNLGTAYTNLNSSGGNTVANQQALIEAEKALDTEIKKVQSSVTSMNATMAKSSAVDSLRQKVQQFYDINTASHGKWGNSLKSIMSQLASGTEVPITKLKELERQFITIQNSARQAGKLGLSFFDTIKQGMSKFSYWTSSTFIIMKTIQEIKEAVSFAKEMDSALTNINYTMDVTKSQLTDIGNSSIQMAKDLKSSASDILGAVTLYANAKETADSILKKSEAAIMLGNVTGMSGQESAKALQSVMNQFELTQDDLMYISDTIQAVSQNMAYDFSKIIAA